MAEEGTFCINADVLRKATGSANSTATAEAYTNAFIKESEGEINTVGGYDFKTNWASLQANYKIFLTGLASDMAAISCINYDMSGFASLTEAQFVVNVLFARVARGLALLKDKTFVDRIINGGS